jgi:hypothetical protein
MLQFQVPSFGFLFEYNKPVEVFEVCNAEMILIILALCII